MDLRSASQNSQLQGSGYDDYDYVYGSPNSDYAAGDFSAGSDYGAGPGWAQPETRQDSDYAAGPGFSRSGQPSSYRTEGNAYPVGIDWGNERPGEWGASSPTDRFSWARQYTGGGGVSGGGISRAGGLSTGGAPKFSVQMSRTVLPKNVNLPTFAGPTWDEGEIKKRARQAAAPGTRALEMKVNQAMSRYYENPNVRRTVLRDTLAGYGLGLSNIRAQAEQTGRASYSQDYARQYQEAMNSYNRTMQQIMTQATQVSTTLPINTQSGVQDVFQGTSPYTQSIQTTSSR